MALPRCLLPPALAALALCACSDPPGKAAGPTATAADADATAAAGDLTQLELGTSDTAVTTGACPGSPGCSCAGAEECSTGVCADSAQTATGKACAYPFGSGCAAGFVAFTATIGEGASVCVPAAPKLCNPCEKDDDCKALGSSGALCIDRGAAGRFCGVACPGGTCISGYVCADATGASGAKAKQCQPSEQRVPPFSCACSVAATGLKLSTPCQVVNAVGACAGQRACGASGLGACTGKVAALEVCDGADNDCNGQTAEGALCDDGSACTVGDGCVGGKCAAGVAAACNDKNDCTDDSCDPKTGKCVYVAVAGTGSCDDGDPCTESDSCTAGKCAAGSPKLCDGGPCTIGQCDKTSGKCAFANKADGTGCDDGDPCTAGETCGKGLCQGGTSLCQCKADGDCPDDGKVCNGVPYCDKSTAAWACKLNPGSVKVCTPSGEGCKVAQCSEPAGTCGLVNLPDGATCDDGKAWTVGDSCQKGLCTPSLDTKLCKTTADCAGYEDGDLCNGTLFCNKAIGVCQVNPKTVVYCPTVDDTVCRKNLCAVKSGSCVLTAINEQKGCEDGNLCTTGEACQAGICTASAGGDTCLCKQDSDCGKFEDGDACNGKLFCNLAKAQCQLNPATIVQCPSAQDGPCAVNTCDKNSGLCALKATAGKVACDADGSDCTPVDLCKAGTCVADTANVCACQADADCKDDADLCNGVPYCNKATNACVANPKTVVKCETAGDTACSVTVCAAATGKCGKVASSGPCSDGDACTAGDVCSGGGCNSGVNTCGCKTAADCKDDGNACTADLCTVSGACAHLAAAGTCTDGNACTVADKCGGGACLPGTVTACDDGNPCTADGCDPVKGCVAVKLADAVTCSDGDPCTGGDACKGGACVGAAVPCANAVGCPPSGSGKVCANGQGVCDSGHCFQADGKGHKWTLVPAGKFWMGCNAAVDANCTGNNNENPQHEVETSAYWIGVYEVTASQYQACVAASASGCTVPATTGGTGGANYATTGKEDHPVNFVTWAQAQAACQWLGGGLPTEAQWEKAARGGCELYAGKDCKTSEPKYPWGSGEPTCGTQAVYYVSAAGCQTVSTFAVGAGSALGQSPYGAFDMAGNVLEWAQDDYDNAFYAKAAATAKDAVNTTAGTSRTGRGGSYGGVLANQRASFRSGNVATTPSNGLGMRCAKPMLETVCDGKDDNGNGATDEGCDDDKDGYCDAAMTTVGTPAACTKGGGDCNDVAGNGVGLNPGAVETCDGVDNNCDGKTDEVCNAVGCLATGVGGVCGKGKGTCDNGHCQHTESGYKWTLVPAGKFWMGCNPAVDSACSGNANENPQHEVDLSAYWIGVYEVTADLYKQCVTAGANGCSVPSTTTGQYATYATSGKEQHPINYVNWAQSQAVCKWMGGDLPTEAQWEKAARGGCEAYAGKDCGKSEPLYPWGGAAPVCAVNAVTGGAGQCAATMAVGAGSASGQSPYGAFDMAGNVWEWVADWYDDTFYGKPAATAKDPVNAAAATTRVIRGNNFSGGATFLRAGSHINEAPATANGNLGVRCAKPAN